MLQNGKKLTDLINFRTFKLSGKVWDSFEIYSKYLMKQLLVVFLGLFWGGNGRSLDNNLP